MLPGFLAPVAIVVSLVFDVGLWLLTFKVLTNHTLPWKALLPGAILGAVGLEVLKWFGGIYVPKAVASSSALYGSLGTVFASRSMPRRGSPETKPSPRRRWS